MHTHYFLAAAALVGLGLSTAAMAETPAPVALTPETINRAAIQSILIEVTPRPQPSPTKPDPAAEAMVSMPDPAMVRLQVLLDRAGASPGVIDGFGGDNVAKAILAFELMQGLPADGALGPEVIARIESPAPVVGAYLITNEDAADISGPVPADYADKAKMAFLGYASIAEKLAERFHMDIDLLKALNPGAAFVPGERISVTAYGPDRDGVVTRIEADKTLRQVRGYAADGTLLVAYPATIGSPDNPSPSGTHLVDAVVPMPNYTYNPAINFTQGQNKDILTIPPGPNGPVGSVWIDLTEPTFGIHGTPEPSMIDKTGSHGCIRLTNWDAEELSKMVAKGVPVEFLGA